MVAALGEKPIPSGEFLYLDIETVPDEWRAPSFGLPVPEDLSPDPDVAIPTPELILASNIDAFERLLSDARPDDKWLNEVIVAENLSKKPRAGILKAAEKLIQKRVNQTAHEDEMRKLQSVTPEYCKIVAIALAVGNGPVETMLVGEHVETDTIREETVLSWIWDRIAISGPIVGYCVGMFDLPAIMARSAILGVDPSKRLNLSKYASTDVIDLYVKRFPNGSAGRGPGKLKELAGLYGIDVPAGDVDGSQVEELWRNDPAKLREYVASDVTITRELHRKWLGLFC